MGKKDDLFHFDGDSQNNDLFSFDSDIVFADEQKAREMSEKTKNDIAKARTLCIRGKFDEALKIYEGIVEVEFENVDAYIGILRVHSRNFTLYEGATIAADIKTITQIAREGRIRDEEYNRYLAQRDKELTKVAEEKARKAAREAQAAAEAKSAAARRAAEEEQKRISQAKAAEEQKRKREEAAKAEAARKRDLEEKAAQARAAARQKQAEEERRAAEAKRKAQAEEEKKKHDLRTAKVGDIKYIGSYEQGAGLKPVAWQVLAIEDGKMLLASCDVLDYQPYYDKLSADPTWEGSDLRRWMHGTFFVKAFSPEEKELIYVAPNSDRVFLLTKDEVTRYFDKWKRELHNTSYSARLFEGIRRSVKAALSSFIGVWWLGLDKASSPSVGPYVDGYGDYANLSLTLPCGVRPAMWVCMSDDAIQRNKEEIARRKQALAERKRIKEAEAAQRQKLIEAASTPTVSGDTMTFGSYPYAADGTLAPLKWQILDEKILSKTKTEKQVELFVCTKDIIDVYRFGYPRYQSEGIYGDSYLKLWIENEFFNTAFDLNAQQYIVNDLVDNGSKTMYKSDKRFADNYRDFSGQVYPLSYGELKKYFKNDKERRKVATPYAKAKGLANTIYWTRSGCDFIFSPEWKHGISICTESGDITKVVCGNAPSYVNGNAYETPLGVVVAMRVRLTLPR